MTTLKTSVITSQTGFDVDFCFRMVMSTYHHAATFEGLADEFNDLHCKGILFKTQSALLVINYSNNMSINMISDKKMFCKDYETVDEARLKINQQRVADAFFTFTFLELNER